MLLGSCWYLGAIQPVVQLSKLINLLYCHGVKFKKKSLNENYWNKLLPW